MNYPLTVAIADIIVGLVLVIIIWLHLTGRLRKWTQRSSSIDGAKKRSGLVLAAVLILAGAVVIESSSLVIRDMNDDSSAVRDLFEATLFQAYVVAVVGVGMLILHMLPRPTERVPLLRRTNPLGDSPGGHGILSRTVPPEKQLGTGVKILLYFLSVLSPMIGSVAGTILYTREEPDYVRVGKTCLVLAAVVLVIGSVLGTLLYSAFGVPDGTG